MNPRPSSSRAFSLIELLTVIAIMMLMLALLVPAFQNMARASQLSSTAQMMVDTCNLARQTASTQNRRVEMRFYKLPDEGDASKVAYRAMQLFLVQPDGLQPMTRMLRFPAAVIVSDVTNQSTVLTRKSGTDNWTIPGVGSNYTYASFRFLPPGETDLPATNEWLATFVVAAEQKNAQLPANYATARIDPASGKVMVFRP